jgi:hypothetical protein
MRLQTINIPEVLDKCKSKQTGQFGVICRQYYDCIDMFIVVWDNEQSSNHTINDLGWNFYEERWEVEEE